MTIVSDLVAAKDSLVASAAAIDKLVSGTGLTALTGADSATGDKITIYDVSAAELKHMTRAELALAMVAEGLAVLASPAFTGNPTAPTQSAGNSSTRLATTGFVQQEIATAVASAYRYQGIWNASTNSPALASGVGTAGYVYRVGTAGSTTLDGISSWSVGDHVAFNGTVWEKLEGVLTSAEVIAALGYTPANKAGDTITGTLAMSGAAVNEAKGTDLASASTVNIGAANGNLVHITGTTTITAFDSVQAGTERTLVFDGALTLTHNSTTLILPTGANIVTAAGDTARMKSEGSGNWRCVSYQRKDGTPLAGAGSTSGTGQVVSTVTGAAATGTTALPADDTIPQNTEGDQYMSLAITPASATSKLVIDVVWAGSCAANETVTVALFQDSTANALAAVSMYASTVSGALTIPLRYVMTSGTTSATTFKVRVGTNGGGSTITFNGIAGSRKFGGVMASSIVIREVLP